MTEEQQRIAIAAHLGRETLPTHKMKGKDENRYFQCEQCGITQGWGEWSKTKTEPEGPCANTLDEYLEDLNAAHEMEKTLTEDQRTTYIQILTTSTSDEQTCDLDPVQAEWNLAHATAAQRAEAFLKTVGEWRKCKCDLGNGEWDHNWQEKSDDSGGVGGGPSDRWSWRECRVCGEIQAPDEKGKP